MHASLRCPTLVELGDPAKPITYSKFVCSVQEQDLVLLQIPAALAARTQQVADSSAAALLALEALEVCRLKFPALVSSVGPVIASSCLVYQGRICIISKLSSLHALLNGPLKACVRYQRRHHLLSDSCHNPSVLDNC